MRLFTISSLILIFLFLFKLKSISAYGRIYTSNEGNKYYIETDQKFTWTEAVIKCMEMNMTLMSVDTKEKANEIDQIFRNEFGKTIYVWVGGMRSRYPQDHFVWLSTGKEFNYTNWEKSNPNFQRKEQFCVEIGYDNMEWNDLQCHTEIGYICETRPLQQEIQNQQKLHKDIENLRLTLKQQQEQCEEKEIQYKLESYQMEVKHEMDKQQFMQKQLFEIEKILRNELDNLMGILKQQMERQLKVKEFNNRVQTEKIQEQFSQVSQLSDRKYRDIVLNFHQS